LLSSHVLTPRRRFSSLVSQNPSIGIVASASVNKCQCTQRKLTRGGDSLSARNTGSSSGPLLPFVRNRSSRQGRGGRRKKGTRSRWSGFSTDRGRTRTYSLQATKATSAPAGSHFSLVHHSGARLCGGDAESPFSVVPTVPVSFGTISLRWSLPPGGAAAYQHTVPS
jgi:hypothetical protein